MATVGALGCGDDDGNYAEEDSDAESQEAMEDDDVVAGASDSEAPGEQPVAVVEPVRFQELLPFLPPTPDGWTADQPNGSTTAMPGYKVTMVSSTYRRAASDGSPEQRVTAEITDGGFAEMVAAPFTMMSQFSSETTEGYQRGVTVEGHPGYEDWNNASRSSNLNVLVAKRFLIHLGGSGVEPDVLREWLGEMNLDDLTELAEER